VHLLRAELDRNLATAGVAVGTVDKFQGREAAVVFFTMTSSSAADVSRGADFLFSRNRLNVAVSRARCLAYLVCTEELLNSRGRDVEEMRLISTLCSFVDREVGVDEVIPDAENRVPGPLRKGVGAAVAEVQLGGVAAFAEAAPRVNGPSSEVLVEGDHLDLSVSENPSSDAHCARHPRLGDDAELQCGRSGQDARARVGQHVGQPRVAGFTLQHCDEGGGVDDQPGHAGAPVAS
jgi:hypothetical protein